MFKFTGRDERSFIGLILQGFLYGLYSGIFAMYLQYRASEKTNTVNKQNTIFYSICALYILSAALFIADAITLTNYQPFSKSVVSGVSIYYIVMTLFGCCDFIAQSILIYRCWIVWGCNIRVVIIPSILTLAFLVVWLTGSNSASSTSSGKYVTPHWGYLMALSGLILSLTVNALVTGLIVFRIVKVFRQVGVTANDQILGTNGGSKLRRTILILIESGMLLFTIQLVRVVYSIVDNDAFRVTSIVTSIHNMLNGITPTTILVRTSMGLSFHDEKSMEEAAMGSSGFVFNRPNSVVETRSITIADQDSGDDDIGVERSNDIDIIQR